MFVCAAKNFSQLFRRFRYLQEFSAYRKQQIKEIEAKQTEIQKTEENIVANIEKKNDFINEIVLFFKRRYVSLII